MATMWRRAMLYLGLGPDDEYEDELPLDEQAAARGSRSAYGPEGEVSTVRPIPAGRGRRTDPGLHRERAVTPAEGFGGEVGEDSPAVTIKRQPSVVRTIAPSASAKPHVVTPRSFNQAQEIADRFRDGQPVIMNLQQLERDLSRRLIDFASGLCYGLAGKMEKVANQVYLLTPANVEVSPEDRRRINERGLHD